MCLQSSFLYRFVKYAVAAKRVWLLLWLLLGHPTIVTYIVQELTRQLSIIAGRSGYK